MKVGKDIWSFEDPLEEELPASRWQGYALGTLTWLPAKGGIYRSYWRCYFDGNILCMKPYKESAYKATHCPVQVSKAVKKVCRVWLSEVAEKKQSALFGPKRRRTRSKR